MPVELSAPPFAGQQLPYAPKFVPHDDVDGDAQSLASGPRSIVGSAFVPAAQRGQISTPHRAIPALSEAGYTHPSLRVPAPALPGYAPSSTSKPYGVQSSYLPTPTSPQHPAPYVIKHTASTAIRQDGWMPASLPVPRRAPPPALTSDVSQREPHRLTTAIPSARSIRRHSPSDDESSDGSYYSRAKDDRHRATRTRASSAASSVMPSRLTPRIRHHGRHEHHHQHHTREYVPPVNLHSPVSPSPLSAVITKPRRIDTSHLQPSDASMIPPPSVDERFHDLKNHERHASRPRSNRGTAIPPSLSRRAPDTLWKSKPIAKSVRGPYRRNGQMEDGLGALSLDERQHHHTGAAAGYSSSMYQAPSVLGVPDGQASVYDDRASVAGSALTFLDGPIDGRTSHYGLPKYPRDVKPDYRRFMVQRGNADVYLD
ncbi:hypothetical protein BD324DRAFT_518834 [Kockovaella imperatae]|uniref:Uncharacterized protein n=1 Tax=Kockovaella imperatae TaxID=4999 RepID=A0A1Y1UDA9_9TREE|nr:hypothetical protein BD324DRAFT_518834 [Kockovaella imperatae]ORX36021.1 hypothetical protein BD324DRAFT_518834 [Kockovaella imperatae]